MHKKKRDRRKPRPTVSFTIKKKTEEHKREHEERKEKGPAGSGYIT